MAFLEETNKDIYWFALTANVLLVCNCFRKTQMRFLTLKFLFFFAYLLPSLNFWEVKYHIIGFNIKHNWLYLVFYFYGIPYFTLSCPLVLMMTYIISPLMWHYLFAKWFKFEALYSTLHILEQYLSFWNTLFVIFWTIKSKMWMSGLGKSYANANYRASFFLNYTLIYTSILLLSDIKLGFFRNWSIFIKCLNWLYF